jgi:RNA polymerase sigma-70 factor (ECF subfamily)
MSRSTATIATLYTRYGALVLRRARALLGDEQASWDALQEVFVKALKAHGDFRGQSAATTWLYRITTNYCLNLLRDGSRRRDLLTRKASAPTGPDADTADLRLTIARVLHELPVEICEIAVYAHVDGMSQDEIADLVGLSRKTVGQRLRMFQDRARQMLGYFAEVST